MSNPNPSPDTRFGAAKGNTPGRKHTKDRLSQAFLKDLQEIWALHGKHVLETLANSPDGKGEIALAKIVASLEPKEVEITRPLDGLTDAELAELIDQLRAKRAEEQPVTVN